MNDVIADRYELREELGAGGMARVMAAYDRTLGRDVAVKLLHGDVLAQPSGRDRFLHEARAAASFSHPAAVAVYDTGTENGVPYIVMELVEGPSLAAVLDDRGALTPPEATAVASQLLAALGAAHRRGLVHRDIKPANVLIPDGDVPRSAADEPMVKLADFGIAKGIEQAQAGLTATGQVLGTPKYVSPEQVGGAAATPRSDVYSVGVMLYEMLAGAPPFEADSPLALAFAHRNDEPPRLDRQVRGLDRGLAKVVHRALEKDPEDRFADADEFRQALADPRLASAAPKGTLVLDPAEAPTERLGPYEESAAAAPGSPRRRGPWRMIVLVAVLALAALAVVAVDWEGLIGNLLETPEVEEEPEDPEEPEPEEPEPDEPAEPEPEPEPDEPPPEEDPPPQDDPPEEDPDADGEEPDENDQGRGPDGDGPPGLDEDDGDNADEGAAPGDRNALEPDEVAAAEAAPRR